MALLAPSLSSASSLELLLSHFLPLLYTPFLSLLSFRQSHQRQMPWHNWQQTAYLAKIYRHILDRIEASTCFLCTLYSVQCTPTCAAYCTLLYNIKIYSNPCALHTVHFTSYDKTFKTSMVFLLLAWQLVSFS